MVQSNATVDTYVDAVEPERADAIRRLRDECRARLAGWEERMQWGMPGYGPPGADARISFNSQQNYISVYPGKTAIDAHRDPLVGLGKVSFGKVSFGKGCVRFGDAGRIDFAVVGAMLDEAYRAKA